MPPTMSQTSLHELLQLLRYDYRQTPGKGARGVIIDQWCRASGHERKYAIKILRGQRGPEVVGVCRKGPAPERGGSVKLYGPEVVGILKAIWLQNEQPGKWGKWGQRCAFLDKTTRRSLIGARN